MISIVYLYPTNLYSRDTLFKCDKICLRDFSEKLSNEYHTNLYIYIHTKEDILIQNDFKPNHLLKSQVIRDLIENIYIIDIFDKKNISLYEDISKFIKKKGVRINSTKPISMNSILTNSLPILHTPFSLNKNSTFLDPGVLKMLNFNKSSLPTFYPSKTNLYLKKIILESITDSEISSEISNYSNDYFSVSPREIEKDPFTFTLTPDEIKKIFHFNSESSEKEYLLFSILYDRLLQKNFSVGADFPGMGYGFSEYITDSSSGYLNMVSDGSKNEFLYIIPSQSLFFYFYTENLDPTNLLSILKDFNKLFSDQIPSNIQKAEAPSELIGFFIPENIPPTHFSNLLHMLHPMRIEETLSGIYIYQNSKKPSFYHLKKNIYIHTDFPGVQLEFVHNNKGEPIGLHLANGILQTYKIINISDFNKIYYSFFFSLTFFVTISFFLIVNIFITKNHFLFLKWRNFLSPLTELPFSIYSIHKTILLSSLSFLIYFIILISFIIPSKTLTDDVLFQFNSNLSYLTVYTALTLILIILLGSKIILFSFTNELNSMRKIKYLLYFCMVLYFYTLIYVYDFIKIPGID